MLLVKTWITAEMVKATRANEFGKIAEVVKNYRRTGAPAYFMAAQVRLTFLDPYYGERFAAIRTRIPMFGDSYRI